jgi:addiction module HigA family antidote
LQILASSPGNQLEALRGDRKGQHSIRINDQWRICFVWGGCNCYDVEIVDYHLKRSKARMSKPGPPLPPVHLGEILREDFMKPVGLTVNKLALELHVPATRIGEIVHEIRRITAETALRLARYFNTNAEFWLNLQTFYDLEVTRRSGKVSEIERQVHTTAGFLKLLGRVAQAHSCPFLLTAPPLKGLHSCRISALK